MFAHNICKKIFYLISIIIDIINNLYKNSLFNNYLIIISLFKFYLLKFLLFQ